MDSKFIKKPNGDYTIGITDGDLTEDDGFDTAINISLLSDRRATDIQVTKPEHRRGWLGDVVSTVDGREKGSWLWLINQSKLIQDTLNKAINYGQLALNWFMEDGIAKKVVVAGEIVPLLGIKLEITITAPDGVITTHYRELWEMTGNGN